jgi:hypothetical protein
MRKGTVFLAWALILFGVYALLMRFHVNLPPPDRVWPLVPCASGVVLLLHYMRSGRREHSQVFWGTALTLTGLFFFLITLNERDYGVLATWWPVFVVIGGISFLALWLAQGPRERGTLFVALVGIAFGSFTLAANVRPTLAPGLPELWPALLILLGLLLLLREAFQKKVG